MLLKTGISLAIKRLRRIYGMPQEMLALSAGIDRRYLSDIENAKRNLSLDMLERLATCFEIPVSTLIYIAEHNCNGFDSVDALKDALCDADYEDSVVFESPDYLEAIIGIDTEGRVAYSHQLMLLQLMKDGMSREEALEFIDFNTIRAFPYMGEKAPVIIYDIEQ